MKRASLTCWLLVVAAQVCPVAVDQAQAQSWGGLFGGSGNSGWGGGWGGSGWGRRPNDSWGYREGGWHGRHESSNDIDAGRIIHGAFGIADTIIRSSQDSYYRRYPRQYNSYPRTYSNTRTYSPAPSNARTRTASVTTPKNSIASVDAKPQSNAFASQRFSLAGRESGKQAGKQLDALSDKLADDLINKYAGMSTLIVTAATNAKNGDPSGLQRLIDMGVLTGDDKIVAQAVIDAQKAAGQAIEGGLNSSGNKRNIADIENALGNLSTGRGQYQGLIDGARDRANNQALLEAVGDGMSSGGMSNSELANAGINPFALNGPFYVVEPVQDEEVVASSMGKVVLTNPHDNGESVGYVLEGLSSSYALEPGYTQRLKTSYTIRFDTGNGAEKRYKLPPGSYEFILTDKGWDLKKKTYVVTIDNADYPHEFNYVADNKRYSLEQGDSKTHTSSYPIVVRFDRGDGNEATKELAGGEYVVGIDLHEGRLDLFEDEGRRTSVIARNGDDPSHSDPIESLASSDDDDSLVQRLNDLSPAERRTLKKLLEE